MTHNFNEFDKRAIVQALADIRDCTANRAQAEMTLAAFGLTEETAKLAIKRRRGKYDDVMPARRP
jgi:hypothetical protein